MRYAQATGRTIQEAFENYHHDNPKVYEFFKKYSFLAIERDYKKYSAKQILGRARWHLEFEAKGDCEYKINDAFTSRYARLFASDFPEHADFFNYRHIRSE